MKKVWSLRKKAAIIGWLWLGMICIIPGISVCAQETVYWETATLEDTLGTALTRAKSQPFYRNRSGQDWSYGSQLSGKAAVMYQAMAEAGDMRQYNKDNSIFMPDSVIYYMDLEPAEYVETEGFLQARLDWNKAIHAYIKDYGEQYWVYNFVIGYVPVESSDQRYIKNLRFYPLDYYAGIQEEIADTNNALAAAISHVADAGDRYEKVKAAQIYVADLVEYNYADMDGAYGHTITGGLLEKYDHLGVCECYAKLFRLLCEKNGIPCILVVGGSSLDSAGDVIANHMWNYVQMEDGQWYLVDVTWDDRGDGDSVASTYFLAGSNSRGSSGKTVSQDHMAVGRFSVVEYEPFLVPTLAETAYVPKEKEPPTDPIIETEPPTDPIIEHTHSFDNGRIVKAATCTSEGSRVHTCQKSGCGETRNTVIPKTEHTAGAWETEKSPTVFMTGTQAQKCKVCKQVLNTRTIAKVKAQVTLSAKNLPLQVKKSTKALKVTSFGTGDSVRKWTSSNKKVATVSSKGTITGKKTGTAKITVTMKSGAKASCTVKVQKGTVRTTKITLSRKTVILKKGTAYSIKAVRAPITSTEKLTYSSSNKKVAAVSKSGKITGVKKGKAVITVKSGKKKVKITVTVK